MAIRFPPPERSWRRERRFGDLWVADRQPWSKRGRARYLSERNHRDAYLALVRPGLRVARCIFRVVLEGRTGIELKPAGRQPIPQQGSPRLADLLAGTLEAEDCILATRNDGLEGSARCNEIRRNLGAGVVSTLLSRSNAGVVVAYAVTRLFKQIVRGRPRTMGVHAVAHAIAESGRHCDGAQWMRDQDAQWATESRMRTHNAWHLAMFDAEAGNVASALGILDAWLLPASAGSPLDACDATALLWRLATEGVDDEGRWCKVSDAFERTMTPGFWPYVDLHAALAHLSAGKQARAQRLVHAIGRCAQGSHYAALRARRITQPGLQALGAWAEGRYGEAAGLLADLRPVLADIGGSPVQLEVFKSIEREAVRRQRARQGDQPHPLAAREQGPSFINVKGLEADPARRHHHSFATARKIMAPLAVATVATVAA